MGSSDEQRIIDSLKQQAEAGEAKAQYGLGMLYAHGQGVELNYSLAAQWLERAAEQGVPEAQRTLGWLYSTGYGVDQDDDRAVACYRQAAEGGDAEAQMAMGLFHHFGRHGVERNAGEMLRWYQRAAEQGNTRAQYALGKLMADGVLVQQNDEAAFQWLTLAIMSGSEPAKKELAMLTSRLSEAQIETFKQRMLAAMQHHGHG